jgi:hypothetical protein
VKKKIEMKLIDLSIDDLRIEKGNLPWEGEDRNRKLPWESEEQEWKRIPKFSIDFGCRDAEMAAEFSAADGGRRDDRGRWWLWLVMVAGVGERVKEERDRRKGDKERVKEKRRNGYVFVCGSQLPLVAFLCGCVGVDATYWCLCISTLVNNMDEIW